MVAPIPAKRGRKPAVATAPATGQVQSLTRGLKLLEWIAESNGSVALTELAQQAGLPNSTTHRLLTTMQQQGFVRQVGELGHWAIGAHAFMVGSSFLQSRNLLAIVHPILRNLMEESGETVNMAVLDQSDHEAIIIDQVQCTHLMRMSAPIGGKLPMHASGAGKAFLAQLSEEQVTKLLHRKGLHAYTHATLVSPPKRANGVIHLMMKNMPWDCVVSRHVFSMSTANRLPQFQFPDRFHVLPMTA